MYLPKYHAFTDLAAQHAHIAQHPLGAWVCTLDQQLIANHLPFVLDTSHGQHGRLLGHVARANPVWRALANVADAGAASIVIFTGPQAYITPSWYPSKDEHGKVVPTWNYVTVHAHGTARAIDDPAWLHDMLNRLTQAQESPRDQPWHLSDAPADYMERLQRGIVGIEITIDRLDARLKASQDEAHQDRLGTVAGLLNSSDSTAQAMGRWVQAALDSEA